ncbi:response regulator transcription factor [Clostridium sp. JN-1]|jgi:DNA-binding response OmpR family regulator|uniref:response regulator transcription factor n=1 Tax=Clostridium sp. JN-1 TaxID=2483110 RepID=UPI000F0B1565|nr:response regulator transcription factor [Clostridium sp. JN-1]
MKKILVVEDDKALNNGIVLSLRQNDFNFSQAFTIKEAEEYAKKNEFDLIILDINLPDGSGLNFCSEIRKKSSVPIIFLTANDMEIDVVTGFELGGDDYITKPFSLIILRARVLAILRRTETAVKANKFEIDDFIFDFEKMKFRKSGREIILSKTEQKLLKIMVVNKNSVLPRALLIEKIWTDGAEYVDENALSVTISRLRNKLEDNPNKSKYIQTVYGIGYMWGCDKNETK